MIPQKRNVRSSGRPDSARVIGQVDLIPLFSTIAGNWAREERVRAMDSYFSGIMDAKSAEGQAKSICLAIATFAMHMREIDSSWRETLPQSIQRRAQQAKIDTNCHVEDIRVLCDVAIAHSRAGFAA